MNNGRAAGNVGRWCIRLSKHGWQIVQAYPIEFIEFKMLIAKPGKESDLPIESARSPRIGPNYR
jgi:hypothetical protein